jgi:hypothetical protein
VAVGVFAKPEIAVAELATEKASRIGLPENGGVLGPRENCSGRRFRSANVLGVVRESEQVFL